MSFIDHNGFIVNEDFLELLKGSALDSFDALMGFTGGEVVKKKQTRSVTRLNLKTGDGREEVLYLKRHKETRKKFSFSKLPEDARNEWEMTISLKEDGFDVMVPVAFGERRLPGGVTETLTLTEEVCDTVRLSDYIPSLSFSLKGMAGVVERRRIVGVAARLVRRFHRAGYNHQDLYLVHFFFRPSDGKMFLMDLQRVHKRAELLMRWRVKDLAQFVFSGRGEGGLSLTDLVRFGHIYLDKDSFDVGDRRLVSRVLKKAAKIARHDAKLIERAKKG